MCVCVCVCELKNTFCRNVFIKKSVFNDDYPILYIYMYIYYIYIYIYIYDIYINTGYRTLEMEKIWKLVAAYQKIAYDTANIFLLLPKINFVSLLTLLS